MNIIIPMAGMGKRLRPHTLTTPKPLVPIAGKPIVQHLVEDIAALLNEPIEEMVFVTGRFGQEAETHLLEVAQSLGAKGSIAYQDEALGTAHAVWCAKEALKGKVIVAFADTLFRADFKLDDSKAGVLWVSKIDDPSAFGVVTLNEEGNITEFFEKPKTFVSDLAMIGIYYFREGEELAKEIKHLIDNNLTKGGEYQLPDALKRMVEKGAAFAPGEVSEWMDCGNPQATIETNERILYWKYPNSHIDPAAHINNSLVLEPCYIGAGARLTDSIVGPYASIGSGTIITNCRISHAIIQSNSHVEGANLQHSMIGNHSKILKPVERYNVGDYNEIG